MYSFTDFYNDIKKIDTLDVLPPSREVQEKIIKFSTNILQKHNPAINVDTVYHYNQLDKTNLFQLRLYFNYKCCFSIDISANGFTTEFTNDSHKCSKLLLEKTSEETDVFKAIDYMYLIYQCDKKLEETRRVSNLIKQYCTVQAQIAANNIEDYLDTGKRLVKFRRDSYTLFKYNPLLFEEIKLVYQNSNYEKINIGIYKKGNRKKHSGYSCEAIIPTHLPDILDILIEDFHMCYDNDTKCVVKIKKYTGEDTIPELTELEF